MVNVLREAVLLEQLVRGVLELGEGLRGAADVTQGRGALRRAGIRAGEQQRAFTNTSNHHDHTTVQEIKGCWGSAEDSASHLTEAVRERCSLESITQPT